MNKAFRVALIIFLVLVLLIVLCVTFFVAAFIYGDRFQKTEIYTEVSPDGAYTFVLNQIGQPGFPFGPVKAEIKVCDAKGKTLDKCTFYLNNDGTSIWVGQIKEIRWYDTGVEMRIHGADDYEDSIYSLSFES